MAKIKKIEWHWLRTSTMFHEGYHDGMPWNAAPLSFEKLWRLGLVDRIVDGVNEENGKPYYFAVATSSGRAVLRKRGAELAGNG